MPPTTQRPTITPEGQAAAKRIAAARAERNANPTSVTADQLSQPVSQVTVPQPQVAETTPVNDNMVKGVGTNTQNIIAAQTQEAADLKALRDQQAQIAGEGTLSELFSLQQEQFGIPENLKTLQDLQLQMADMDTESNITQTRIGQGNSISQGNREITQEQRENAVRQAGTAARAAILQGNIETASALVSQAVQTAYQDRTMRNTNLINQISSLQGVVDDQTGQLLTQEARKYEQENFQMEQAVSSVNSAVASGFASADDVATMTSLSGDPEAQKQFADKIIAKGARTQYMNALAATQAARNAASKAAGDTVKGEAAARAVGAETALDVIDVIKNNPLGLKAIAGANWFGRTALSTAFESMTKGFVGGTAVGATAGLVGGPLAPVTVTGGGALGGVVGGVGGTISGTVKAGQQRADVSAALGYLVNSGTFSEMRRLRSQGVTFGSLTEGERVAIGKSADALFSALEVDEQGAVTGVNSSEENFDRLLNDFQMKQQQYLAEANAVASGMSREDMEVINNL